MKVWFFISFFLTSFSLGQDARRACSENIVLNISVSQVGSKVNEANVLVKIHCNDSLISIGKTDTKGKFVFSSTLPCSSICEVSIRKEGWYDSPPTNVFIDSTESGKQTLSLELGLLELKSDPLPKLPCFSKNEYKTYTDFEEEYFVDLLNEYPELCLNIFYTPGEGEAKNIARKRKRTIIKKLQELNIDMSRLHFVSGHGLSYSGCDGCFCSSVHSFYACE